MADKEEPKWPPFNPFVRRSTPLIGKVRMGIFSFLVPLRLIGAIMTLITGLIWCHICSIGCDTSKPYHPLRRRLLLGGLRIASRVLLFFYGELICASHNMVQVNTTDICHYFVYIILSGFVWINQSYEIESPQERRKQTDASVFVVNHIGFAELMYLLYSDGCCFVSKAENKKLPFIGSISMILQSIFVDRVGGKKSTTSSTKEISTHSTASSNVSNIGVSSTVEQIHERAHSKPGTWPPLCLCPEGTTTTGHCLIRFQNGAFRAGLPIQPIIVSSPFSPIWGYDPSFSCANIVTHIIGLMTQPHNSLHVKHLAVYVPSEAEKSDPNLYANNVRAKMAKEMGVECYELTWTDKLRFERSDKAKELGKKKLAVRHGGVVPPMPKFTQDSFGIPLLESNKDK